MKINLRGVGRRQKQFGRQVLSGLKKGKDLPDGLSEKAAADALLRLAFTLSGTAGLNARQEELSTLLAADALEQPWVEALLYSGQAERAHNTVQAHIAEHGPDAWRLSRLIDTSTLVCDFSMARDVVKELFGFIVRNEISSTFRRNFAVLKALTLGMYDWVETEADETFKANTLFRWAERFEPGRASQTPALVINMDRDITRLHISQALMSEYVAYKRTAGLPGSAIPDAVLAAAGMRVEVPRRAQIGCHLSHFRAWERFAKELDDNEYGLVLEDDAVFSLGQGRGLDAAVAGARAEGLDILFINEEVTQRVLRFTSPDAPLQIFSPMKAFESKAGLPGWGGCGYLVSRVGAAKLLEIHLQLGILTALDWQIALYAMPDISSLPPHGRYGTTLERLSAARVRNAETFTLKGGISGFPVIRPDDLGYKTHNVEQMITATS